MKFCTELVVSCGDPQGIGPEVAAAAALRLVQQQPDCTVVLVGLASQMRALVPEARLLSEQGSGSATELRCSSSAGIWLLPVAEEALPQPPPSAAAGRVALCGLQAALARVRTHGGALVTAPLSKQAVAFIEPSFRGHTDWLGEQFGCAPLMLFSAPGLKLALATVHLPLAHVPAAIRAGSVEQSLRLLHAGLRSSYGVAAPRIAVLALNPHAGEGGLLGSEEAQVIAPAIEALRHEGLNLEGPFSADGFFGAQEWRRFDAVLAMYHDQGLVAVKSLGFGHAVNVTLGLPIVRTSVDHGCAFSLVGRGLAQCDSMLAALQEGLLLLRLRNSI